MAIIRLTKGCETIVDDELYGNLNSYRWHASGLDRRPARRLRAGPRKMIFIYHQILHILPWVMHSLGLEVDHIDGDCLNNQLDNLRLGTHTDNMRNKFAYGYRQGVCYDTTHDKWKAYIDQTDLPRINVGTYWTHDEALAALSAKKLELGIEDNQN